MGNKQIKEDDSDFSIKESDSDLNISFGENSETNNNKKDDRNNNINQLNLNEPNNISNEILKNLMILNNNIFALRNELKNSFDSINSNFNTFINRINSSQISNIVIYYFISKL